MSDEEKDQLRTIMDKHAASLSEHFDSVRVFCTKQTEDGECNTVALDVGRGNFYAQLGHIIEWLRVQDQYQRNWAIRRDAEDHE